MDIKRTGRLLGKQLLRLLSLLLAVSILSFCLVSLSPIDPVQQYVLGAGNVSTEQRAAIAQYWGVGDPPVQRYLKWLGALLRGDLGVSLLYRQPVLRVIGERFRNSFALMGSAWLLSGVLGFGLGCVMGVYQGKWPDRILKRICLILSAIPSFWLGLMLLLVFSVGLGWFPVGFSRPMGMAEAEIGLGRRLYHLALPALTLSLLSLANVALHTRQKLADVLSGEFVLFAKARGEGPWTILKSHGIRNILLPAVTLQFASFGELFGGSVLAEQVFSYPGLGSAVSAAGLSGDVPLLLGIALFSTLFVFAGNFIANTLYPLIDPRIREERPHGPKPS